MTQIPLEVVCCLPNTVQTPQPGIWLLPTFPALFSYYSPAKSYQMCSVALSEHQPHLGACLKYRISTPTPAYLGLFCPRAHVVPSAVSDKRLVNKVPVNSSLAMLYLARCLTHANAVPMHSTEECVNGPRNKGLIFDTGRKFAGSPLVAAASAPWGKSFIDLVLAFFL